MKTLDIAWDASANHGVVITNSKNFKYQRPCGAKNIKEYFKEIEIAWRRRPTEFEEYHGPL